MGVYLGGYGRPGFNFYKIKSTDYSFKWCPGDEPATLGQAEGPAGQRAA